MSYFILIFFQLCILVQFCYLELSIPCFSIVDFNDNPIPYEMSTLESSYVFIVYAVGLLFHFFMLEEVFKRRNDTMIWDKTGLRAAIQIGFTIIFYFLHIVLFSNLQTRHHIESILTKFQFLQYRTTITFIYLIPIIICLFIFKPYAIWKNILILISISGVFTLLESFTIYYYQISFTNNPFNDVEEERRIVTNILPIDISVAFILWREKMRNLRLDKIYAQTHKTVSSL